MVVDKNRIPSPTARPSRLDRRDILTILALLLIVFASKSPVLKTPYHWDEIGAYFAPADWLSERPLSDALPGRHPAATFFGHPPLLYVAAAALFKAFGRGPMVAHLFAVSFSALGAIFTYRLGRLISSWEVGAGAALLLFSFPLYFAQSGMFLGDVPIAALGVVSVYFWLARRPALYAATATAMVLVKETAVLLVIVLLAADLLRRRRGAEKIPWLPHLAPLLVIAAFFLAQKISCGKFLPNPYFEGGSLLALSPPLLLRKGALAAYWTFAAQGRFLLTGAVAYAAWRSRARLPWFFAVFSAVCAAYVAAFTSVYFIPRYVLIAAPFLCLMAAAAMRRLLRDRRIFAGAVLVPVLLAPIVPPEKRSGYGSFETSMQYLQSVAVNREAAAALERDARGGTVLAPWPLTEILAEPRYGYVGRPLLVTSDPGGRWDVVAVTAQADPDKVASLRALAGERKLALAGRFARGGKEVEIYR